MSRKPALSVVKQSQEYFHELLTASLGRQRVSTKPETEFYLVNLLNQFMVSENLYSRDGNGNVHEEPLALMLKQALETQGPENQQLMFRHVGDVSLYTAGFFQDSLSRKLVDVDYYIGMGGNAYKQAAARALIEMYKAVFQELADKFSRLVEVLAEISDKTSQKSEKDLLRTYELWVRTGSKRAEKALKDAGIVPNANIKKKLQ
jgi:hypothetical protein